MPAGTRCPFSSIFVQKFYLILTFLDPNLPKFSKNSRFQNSQISWILDYIKINMKFLPFRSEFYKQIFRPKIVKLAIVWHYKPVSPLCILVEHSTFGLLWWPAAITWTSAAKKRRLFSLGVRKCLLASKTPLCAISLESRQLQPQLYTTV